MVVRDEKVINGLARVNDRRLGRGALRLLGLLGLLSHVADGRVFDLVHDRLVERWKSCWWYEKIEDAVGLEISSLGRFKYGRDYRREGGCLY